MQFESITRESLERIKPLWLDLHAHHRRVAPELGPYVDDAKSWKHRHALYVEAMANGGSVFVAGKKTGSDLGYGAWRPARMPWPALISAKPRLAEIFSLSVRREHRGKGLGRALADRMDVEIEAAGFANRMVGVVPQNVASAAYYRRLGFTPVWLILSRFNRDPRVAEQSRVVDVERVLPDEVDALRPLVVSMHHHHLAAAPGLAPYVSDEQSWTIFSRILRVSSVDGLLLRAGPADHPQAMVCADILHDRLEFADTWETAGEIAEIEIVAVAEESRGRGLGGALMRAIGERLSERGIRDVILGAVAANTRAIAFYERLGFQPTWLQMSKFSKAG